MNALSPRWALGIAVLVCAPAIGCGEKAVPAATPETGVPAASARPSALPTASAEPAVSMQPAQAKTAPKGEHFNCFDGKVNEGIPLADAYRQEIALLEGGSPAAVPAVIAGLCAKQTGLEACVQAERTAKRKIERSELTLTGKDGAVSAVAGSPTELAACLQRAFAGAPTGGATSLRYTYHPGLEERGGPKLRIKDAKGTKDIPDEVLARILRQRFAPMRACQTKALATNPKLAGAATFTISIDAGGKGTKVVPSKDTFGDPKLTSCLQTAAADLVFEKPKGGKATVSYEVALTND